MLAHAYTRCSHTHAPSSSSDPWPARAKLKIKYPLLGTAARNHKMRELWSSVANSEQCKVRAAEGLGHRGARART